MLEIMWGLLFFLVAALVVFVVIAVIDRVIYRRQMKSFNESGFWKGKDYDEKTPELYPLIENIAPSSLITVVVAVVLMPLMFLGGSTINPQTNSWGVELASMQDGSSVKGSFFLGSGYIDEKPVYRYYAKVDDAYYYEQVPASSSVVRYTDGKPQKITTEECGSLPWTVNVCSSKTYTFLVPSGTVKTDYVLDAK